jgi:hypothetical protein
MLTLSKNEQEAIDLSNNRRWLKTRLMEARSCLIKELQDKFCKPTFDFDNKRLVSDDGTIALQWQIRSWPDAPESYQNQQTNSGVVNIVKVV